MINEQLAKYDGVIKVGGRLPISYDVRWQPNARFKGLAVFIHGFKGFKDWGFWGVVADYFAKKGVIFLKFNGSHNGTTPEKPYEFADLQAFGNNNFSIEANDIFRVLDAIKEHQIPLPYQSYNEQITLIGHSKGGASALIAASEREEINRVITWASIDNVVARYGQFDQQWKDDGVKYYPNARTGQDMPVFYQLYEDIVANQQRFDLESLVTKFKKPMLVCHGDADKTVSVAAAYNFKKWNIDSQLLIVNSDHVFGGKHPYDEKELPDAMLKVVKKSVKFISK